MIKFFRRFRTSAASVLVVIAALGVFLFSASFNYLSQDDYFVKWLSPDETANYAVSKSYAETGSLMMFEPYNLAVKDIIHPRSFRSDQGWLKPVSFIGLPIWYGQIASIFGSGVLPYLTPLFAAIGLIFFYLFIKEMFGRPNALMSTMLAASFPVYLYFSARSMFHNILFVVLTIIGLYYAMLMARPAGAEGNLFARHWRNWLYGLLGGVAIGAAVTVRASELLWLGPLLVGLYLFNLKRLKPLTLFFFAYGCFMAALPVLYWNEILYGSWRAMGYAELNQSLETLTATGGELTGGALRGAWHDVKAGFQKVMNTVFYFGFRPEYGAKMFVMYVKNLFPWLFWGGLLGGALFIAAIKHYALKRWLFAAGYTALSVVLILYYGSWEFYDNPDPNSFTIGNSYTRYWLPVYLGALPFVSLFLLRVTALFRLPSLVLAARVAVIAAIAAVSVQYVWQEPAEGFAASIEKQRASRAEWAALLELTDPEAVIVTKYHDKLLFPERRVIMGAFDDKRMLAEYVRLAGLLPVYYYNFTFPEKDIVYLNTRPLAEAGLRLRPVQAVTKDFTLYRFEIVPPQTVPSASPS